jgi:hypothetical protein
MASIKSSKKSVSDPDNSNIIYSQQTKSVKVALAIGNGPRSTDPNAFEFSNTHISFLVIYFLFLGTTVLVDQGLLIVGASRSQSGTLRSVGLFWTSDQPIPETST